ncbi:hypothetical protein ACWT_2161 [Actinoplanes sp. SE50]|nr:hypothetical protein ACPL_2286 [Actinoplanes sp. SE50/110]ATO81576.1 hypothetical protein ACWT_2161 [Actinoplanes sp. SE50]SLL98984.1 Ricin-type beta-trefoil lectin domain protein [Actinoplanes sp. SE50/110]
MKGYAVILKLKLCVLVASCAVVAAPAGPASAAPDATTTAADPAVAFVELRRAMALTGTKVADSSPFNLHVAGRGSGYCLDNFASGEGRNNSPVGLWTCNGGRTELWRWRIFNQNIYYGVELVNNASGRCLDYPASMGNTVGAQFNVYDCRDGSAPGQNFHLTNASGGVAMESQATNNAVAVDAFTSKWHGDGSPVGLWYYSSPGNAFQHWYQ